MRAGAFRAGLGGRKFELVAVLCCHLFVVLLAELSSLARGRNGQFGDIAKGARRELRNTNESQWTLLTLD